MLTKNVNGVDVVMSEEEERATTAEWATNDKVPKETPPLTVRGLAEILKSKGFLQDTDLTTTKVVV